MGKNWVQSREQTWKKEWVPSSDITGTSQPSCLLQVQASHNFYYIQVQGQPSCLGTIGMFRISHHVFYTCQPLYLLQVEGKPSCLLQIYGVSPDSIRTRPIANLGFVCEVAWFNKKCSPIYILQLLEKHLPCMDQLITSRPARSPSCSTTPSQGVVFSLKQCDRAYCRHSSGLVCCQRHPAPWTNFLFARSCPCQLIFAQES